jgi:hypothetical protein
MKPLVTVKVVAPALAACLLFAVTGCKTTRQVSEDQQSGFLGDYSMLQRGEHGAANYIYIDKSANWAGYTKIWFKPLELWKSDDPEASLGKMSDETKEMLMETSYNAFHEALTNNFQIVDHGGPDVLIVHGAMTDGRPSKPVANFVTSVYLPLKVLSFGKRLISGTDIGVGVVYVEAEFLDGQTGKRIAAVMDARAGTKALRTKFNNTWGDVKLSFDWWAQRLDKRLMLFKKGDFGTANL